MPNHSLRVFIVFPLLLLGLLVSVAGAESLTSLMGWPDGDEPGLSYATRVPESINSIPRRITRIVYPVMGFPAVFTAGDTLTVFVNGGSGKSLFTDPLDWQVRLLTGFANPADDMVWVGDPVAQAYDLDVLGVSYDEALDVYELNCQSSAGLPPDVFALQVATPEINDTQPAAVRVVASTAGPIRFIHLANAKVADPYAQDSANEWNNGTYPTAASAGRAAALLENVLTDELSLWRPHFAVFGGDAVWGGNFNGEWAQYVRLAENAGTAMFAQPGNHDGYALLAGPDIKEDGLEFYERIVGPRYYSFDVGPYHFVMLNSFDGGAQRRQYSRLLYALPADNRGGFLGQRQFEWLRTDLGAAEEAGQTTLIFLHHDPRGPYVANLPFGDDSWSADETEAWNFDSLAWDSNVADNIADETPLQNSGTKLLRLAMQHGVSHLFIANFHADSVWRFAAGDVITDRDGSPVGGLVAPQDLTIVQTTSVAAGVAEDTSKHEFNGYRVVELRGGAVASVNYAPGALQSAPAGNLWSESINNDGASTAAQIDLINNLPLDQTATTEFYLAPLAEGYRIATLGGDAEIAPFAIGRGEDGEIVLYVEAFLPGVGTDFPAAPGNESRVTLVATPHPTNHSPGASFTVGEAGADRVYRFDATASTDPDGDALKYFWNFGDGFTGCGQQVRHAYRVGNRAAVTLTVVDEHGGSAEAAQIVDAPEECYDTDHDDSEDLCGECGAGGIDPSGAVLMLMAFSGLLVFCGKRKRRENP
jgi:PKD domain/Calcineurin-like phosphoesterase